MGAIKAVRSQLAIVVVGLCSNTKLELTLSTTVIANTVKVEERYSNINVQVHNFTGCLSNMCIGNRSYVYMS